MLETVVLSFVAGLYLALGGSRVLSVGRKEITVLRKRTAGEAPIARPLLLAEGFHWTFETRAGRHYDGTVPFGDSCTDQRTDIINRVCFKTEKLSYWFPREAQVSSVYDCPAEPCEVMVGLSPKVSSPFKEGYVGATKVRFYKIQNELSFPLEKDSGLAKTKMTIGRNKTLWIKPIYIRVAGSLSFFFSASNKPNHTQKSEFKIAITNEAGVLAGFYRFQDA